MNIYYRILSTRGEGHAVSNFNVIFKSLVTVVCI